MLAAFTLAQPFIIEWTLEEAGRPIESQSKKKKYCLIITACVVFAGIAASTALFRYYHEQATCMIRSFLVDALYIKVADSRRESTAKADVISLMSTEMERIRLGMVNLHDLWACALQACIAAWLLYRRLGAWMAGPIALSACCALGSILVGIYCRPSQKVWMTRTQTRLRVTTNAIGDAPALRISGLADTAHSWIQELRLDELAVALRFRTLQIASILLADVPTQLGPVIALAAARHSLDVASAFTSISLIMILTNPLSQIFQSIPAFIAAFTSLDHIQAYLSKDVTPDYRRSGTTEMQNMVEVIDATCGWVDGVNVLNHIYVCIPKGGVTTIVGPSGCGKTTFVKTLLGEVTYFDGQVVLNHQQRIIGYCGQLPYLRNATIRDNITGFSEFNASRYQDILEATDLTYDLCLMAQGDQTLVGGDGATLSGGQKRRVALARALYVNTQLYIFDEILSGLDAHTAAHVFDNVLGPTGLIKRRGGTVVYCTTSTDFVSGADQVLILDQDGRITALESNAPQPYHTYQKGNRPDLRTQITGSDRSFPQGCYAPSLPEDDRSRMQGNIKSFKYYWASVGSAWILMLAGLALTYAFFVAFSTVWVSLWTKDDLNHRSQTFYIATWALLKGLILLFEFLTMFTGLYSLVNRSGAKLHQTLLSCVFNAPLQILQKTDSGVLANLFSQDMNVVDLELSQSIIIGSMAAFVVLGMACVIASASAIILAIYPFLLAIAYMAQRFYLRNSRQLRLLDLEAKAPICANFLDIIYAGSTFRALCWTDKSTALNSYLLDQSQRPDYLLAMIPHWLDFCLNIAIAALGTLVVAMALYAKTTVGLGGAALISLLELSRGMTSLIRFYTKVQTAMGAVVRLQAFTERASDCSVQQRKNCGSGKPPDSWLSSGQIRFDGATAVNLSSSTGEDTHAVCDLSFEIEAGSKVAIVGRTGSGKSSTLALILGLLPLSAGKIILDGHENDQFDQNSLAERIISVSQDAAFLPDGATFRRNLDPSSRATDDDIYAALQAVKIRSIIEQQGGLDSNFQADALSYSEKQLFSLARAIVRKRTRYNESTYNTKPQKLKRPDGKPLSRPPPAQCGGLLLLDEVGASLDTEGYRMICEVIGSEFSHYTVIMATHRLDNATRKLCDTVMVMDGGKLVESGGWEVLSDRPAGLFASMLDQEIPEKIDTL
jgi:ABC-type multidrug transport system fused ATPase/permease subunit